MNLTSEDLQKISRVELATNLNLSLGQVYVKKVEGIQELGFTSADLATNEVISYKLAKEIGLLCPFYKIAVIDQRVYVISEDLNNYGFFQTFADLEMPESIGMSLYEIWDYLENYFKNSPLIKDIPSILEDIIKTYIFDIILGNWDRFNYNWGLVFNEDKVKLAIFDNEFITSYRLPAVSSSISGDIWGKDKKMTLNKKDTLKYEIKRFLQESSSEFIEMFNKILEDFSPNHFIDVLNNVEKEETVATYREDIHLKISKKDEYIEKYQSNYALIKEACEELSRKRK